MTLPQRVEPLVQIEIQYKGGRGNLDAVLDYVCPRLPIKSMVVSGDVTGRRIGEGFLTYVVFGVEGAVEAKDAILKSRCTDRGGQLIEGVDLTKIGGRGKPIPAALTDEESEIVKRSGLALPKSPADYF